MNRYILAIAALILGATVWAQPQEGGPWTKTQIVDGITYYEFRGADLRFGSLPPCDGPYYRWSELKDYLLSRIAIYVD